MGRCALGLVVATVIATATVFSVVLPSDLAVLVALLGLPSVVLVLLLLVERDGDVAQPVSIAAITNSRSRRLRASADEREAIIDCLERHFYSERLTEAEFLERRAAALKAVTRGDLAELLTDLPRLPDASGTRYRMHEAYDDRAA